MAPTLTTSAIPLHNAAGDVVAEAVVDTPVYDLLNQWRWSLDTGGYAYRAERRRGRSVKISMHRFLCGLKYHDRRFVDHINRDRLDNRRANLRVVTRAQQNQNISLRSDNKSGHRGVSWSERDQKWCARAQIDGRRFHLGRYETAEDAAAVAAEWRREHMPFAEADRS